MNKYQETAMSYTPEQLREIAKWEDLDDPDGKEMGNILRSHADALEKLRVAEEALASIHTGDLSNALIIREALAAIRKDDHGQD
jgi:hypothetical protein